MHQQLIKEVLQLLCNIDEGIAFWSHLSMFLLHLVPFYESQITYKLNQLACLIVKIVV